MNFKILILFLAYGFPIRSFALEQKLNIEGSQIQRLNGFWDAYWNRFILPGDFNDKQPDFSMRVTEPWDGKIVNGQILDGTGAITLRTILIGEPQESLAMRIPDVGTAYKMYLNGNLVASRGKISTDIENSVPYLGPLVVGSGKINFDEKNRLEVVLHISNFHNRRGGVWGDIEIGSETEILFTEKVRSAIEAFLAGGLLFMAFYHATLFFRRRIEIQALLFAILCILVLSRQLMVGERLAYSMTYFSFTMLTRLEYLFAYFAVPVFVFFSHRLYPQSIHRFAVYTSFTITILLSMTVLFLPTLQSSRFLIVYQISLVLTIVYLLFAYSREAVRRNHRAIIILVGFMIFGVTIVNDILYSQGKISSSYLGTFGLYAFMISQAYVLEIRFIKGLNQAESLQATLENSIVAYARFVPTQLFELLHKKEITEFELGDQVESYMSVLFADIRNFTVISEEMPPDDNFKFINSYLKRIAPKIYEHEGFIDKYIGDAIMALFADNVDNAVLAAIEMQKEVRIYNQHRSNMGYAPISIGIGIHTGPIMIGLIGYKDRWEGTVISDSVNLASRIEGLTKKLGAKIAISESTFQHLSRFDIYHFRFLGKIPVKGKTESIPIFEILNGYDEAVLPFFLATKIMFEKAINALFDNQRDLAFDEFKKLVLANPHDNVARFYLNKLSAVLKRPVP